MFNRHKLYSGKMQTIDLIALRDPHGMAHLLDCYGSVTL